MFSKILQTKNSLEILEKICKSEKFFFESYKQKVQFRIGNSNTKVYTV